MNEIAREETGRDNMGFSIYVTVPQGQTLKFSVDNYRVEDGFVIFYDARRGVEKRYDGRTCEIENLNDEVGE